MERIVISGPSKLYGSVKISGMKNAAVAVIFGTIAVNDECIIDNLPNISDVNLSLELLKNMGAVVEKLGETKYRIDTRHISTIMAPVEEAGKMRASYYIAGASLARFGVCKVGLPGGCDFGERPIDQHVKAFEAMGAKVRIDEGYIDASAVGGMKAANIYFDCVTVGGTINAILAAVRSDGVTVIDNAAREPHIVDLANFLNFCGADITGAGTDTIKIKGNKQLHGCEYTIIPDMIEAGTFIIAAAATSSRVLIENIIPKHLESMTSKLSETGIVFEEGDDTLLVKSNVSELRPVNIKTLPYPGFPTDMNPQTAVLLCSISGVSRINETIFSDRFRYVNELRRMGASIDIENSIATFNGGQRLKAANVRAVDLRAGAAMVLAGLVAEGTTSIEDIFYIERGYDNIVEKLSSLGAAIKKISIEDFT